MSETTGTKSNGPNLDSAERTKKLTMQRVVGSLPFMSQTAPKEWLADFYCYVTGSKEEDSPYGHYYRWLGEFRSVHCSTGEVLKAANAIFPGIASSMIEAAYVGANKPGGASDGNVMLAFRLGREPDWGSDEKGNPRPNNKTGYRYIMQDIVAPSQRSPLDLLYAEVHAPMIAGSVSRPALSDDTARAAPGHDQGSGKRKAA